MNNKEAPLNSIGAASNILKGISENFKDNDMKNHLQSHEIMKSDLFWCRENAQCISACDSALHPLFSSLEMNLLKGADSAVVERRDSGRRACAGCSGSLSGTHSRCERSLATLAASLRDSQPETPNEDQHTELSPQCPEAQAAPLAISVLSASGPSLRSGSISAQCHSFPILYHPFQSKLSACSDASATSPLIPSVSQLGARKRRGISALLPLRRFDC